MPWVSPADHSSVGLPRPGFLGETPTEKPRLLTIEDDELTRCALERVLDEEGYVVCALAEGTDVERIAEEFRPDLAILDVDLGLGVDGFAVARQLRGISDFPILFLTGKADVEDRLTGFDAGGDDYLVKPFAMAELLARVGVLLKRTGRLTSAAIQVGDLVIDHGSRVVMRGGHLVKLTRTEYELLVVLARNPGRVLSKTALLNHMWGFDPGDAHVVDVHISAIRKKLEEYGQRVVHTVRGVGYVLRF